MVEKKGSKGNLREREYNDKIKENRKRYTKKRNGISEIPFTKISQTFGLFSLLRSRKFQTTGIKASVTLGGWSVEACRKPGRVHGQWKCVVSRGGLAVEVCRNLGRVISGSVS